MPKWILLAIVFSWIATACSTPASAPTPRALPVPLAATLAPTSLEPQGDFFMELPQHEVGETVQAGGYTITLKEAAIANGRLRLVLNLANHSPYEVDLGWAVQVRNNQGTLLRPDTVAVPGPLATGEQREQVWQRETGISTAALNTLRLIYAPHGWSGPVFVFRLGK